MKVNELFQGVNLSIAEMMSARVIKKLDHVSVHQASAGGKTYYVVMNDKTKMIADSSSDRAKAEKAAAELNDKLSKGGVHEAMDGELPAKIVKTMFKTTIYKLKHDGEMVYVVRDEESGLLDYIGADKNRAIEIAKKTAARNGAHD